jgi:hypothetical protein
VSVAFHRAFALWASIGLLFADASVRADSKAQAKARFKDGVVLFQEENYQGALEAFEHSYRIVPKPSVLFNIGMCHKALFHFADALATFHRFFSEAGEQIDEGKRARALEAVREIEQLVGTLSVKGAPDRAVIEVDGHPAGTIPFKQPVVLEPGQYRIRVVAEGFEPMETTVAIAAGVESTVQAALTPLKGSLEVACAPPSAVVTIDEDDVGGCPFLGEALPGDHTISVSVPGMQTVTRTVTVEPGTRATLAISLVPETLPSSDLPADPIPTKTPPSAPTERSRTPWIVGGAALMAVGCGLGGLGAYFNHAAHQDEQTGNPVVSDMDTEPDLDEYLRLEGNYDDISDDLTRHKALMIAGYAAGGAMVAAGLALLVVGLKRDAPSETPDVSVAGTGVAVRF